MLCRTVMCVEGSDHRDIGATPGPGICDFPLLGLAERGLGICLGMGYFHSRLGPCPLEEALPQLTPTGDGSVWCERRGRWGWGRMEEVREEMLTAVWEAKESWASLGGRNPSRGDSWGAAGPSAAAAGAPGTPHLRARHGLWAVASPGGQAAPFLSREVSRFTQYKETVSLSEREICKLLLWRSGDPWHQDRPVPRLLPGPLSSQPEPHSVSATLHLVPGREEITISVTCLPMGDISWLWQNMRPIIFGGVIIMELIWCFIVVLLPG